MTTPPTHPIHGFMMTATYTPYKPEALGQFRTMQGVRDEWIAAQAKHCGYGCTPGEIELAVMEWIAKYPMTVEQDAHKDACSDVYEAFAKKRGAVDVDDILGGGKGEVMFGETINNICALLALCVKQPVDVDA